ncbi:peptide chain release factor N(5)-glutamine methyltransferase [Buchnera aphidicola]|uniref:Release factor glutamine methyltransferase n=1 Tax=Buchnera aphidicola (Therioaphis trifolii) TaxID=1241884 RepID=A0A4D6YM08_9GAMM|nr:peptide chain release factor N(5)-glutamine methyltransferase [Buchnera aphidicola]QCI27130.1 peptide chain release factor N(5)-glutamine methyltransferase [Buchnera aphidicola (Therioaphis trifolii)]
MKIYSLIDYAVKILYNYDTPRLDAELLLSYVIKKTRTWINIFNNFELTNKQVVLFKKLLFRRLNGEPIAYIINKKEFWSLSFFVSKYTLIPRPETEILVYHALNLLNKKDFILDLGTGCGAISLSIAFEMLTCKVFGIDNNHQAIKIAKKNAKKLNIKNAYFFYSNWFSCIKEKFNLIVSNPPYLCKNEKFYISQELFFEPYNSLFAKKNGISEIEYIIHHSQKYLFVYGWLLIEHGWNQKNIVQKIFKKNNFYNIRSYKDYLGYNRITLGQKKY